MTGILRHAEGGLVFEPTILADSNPTIVLEGLKNGQIVNELQVSNPTGSAVVCSVDIHDGSSVIAILEPGLSVAAGETAKLDHDGLLLKGGRNLRVTGANGVHAWVTYYNVGIAPQFNANSSSTGLQNNG